VLTFVLDNSIVGAWLFQDEKRQDCDDLQLQLAKNAVAVVPQHWPVEVANAVVMGERRKRIPVASSKPFLDLLESLPIEMDDATRKQAFADTLNLARQHKLTVYDAAYLELALRRGVPLASLDKELRNAATASGVDCLPEKL
jgi:predicted nucleic acid-binding protein